MLVAMLFIGNVKAQETQILIEDNFEAYTVGNKIAEGADAAGIDWWTTWSDAPGSAEDGVIADLDGNKCAYLTYGNDQVLLLGGTSSGVYDLEFDILIPEGKNGYFNILHDFNGGNSTWALESHLHMSSSSTSAPGQGAVVAGGLNETIVCVYDEWMHFRLHVDTDADIAQYYYTLPGEEEVMVLEWQWSTDTGGAASSRVLDAMDFFPPQNAATSEFYLDNFKCTRIGGETAAELNINPTEINETIKQEETKDITITLENTGTSIAEYSAYVDYGVGEGSEVLDVLSYINPNSTQPSGVGWTTEEPLTFEIASYFPVSTYAETAMGTYITSVAYQFIEFGENDADGNFVPGPGLEEGTNVIFRVYGQGQNGMPGAVLAEKVIPENEIVWNDYTLVTLDEPIALTGSDIYVALEMTQAVDGTVMITDGSPSEVGFGDLFRQHMGSAYQSLTTFSGSDFGNWLLSAVYEGTPVIGGYASLSKSYGTIAIGATDNVTVTLDSEELIEGTYEATLVFNTNIADNPVIEVPITLEVTPISVSEISNEAYNIHPNPTSGKVTVEAENISYIAIYSSTGQLMNVVMNTNVVDMSAYENGVYFFNVVDNAGQKSMQRVVVAK